MDGGECEDDGTHHLINIPSPLDYSTKPLSFYFSVSVAIVLYVMTTYHECEPEHNQCWGRN